MSLLRLGQSDVRKLVKIQVEKRKIKSSTSSSNDSAFDSSYESSTKSDNEDLSHEKRQSTVKSATNVPLSNSTPEKSSVKDNQTGFKTPKSQETSDKTSPLAPIGSSLLSPDMPMPQLLSPIPNSPAPSMKAVTPLRNEDVDDEFVKPFGTPRRMPSTPMHFLNMPQMLSPLPSTPYR